MKMYFSVLIYIFILPYEFKNCTMFSLAILKSLVHQCMNMRIPANRPDMELKSWVDPVCFTPNNPAFVGF